MTARGALAPLILVALAISRPGPAAAAEDGLVLVERLGTDDRAAIERAVAEIERAPAGTPSLDYALFRAGQACEDTLADPARALALYERLVRELPEAGLAIAAGRRIARLRAQLGAGGQSAREAAELATSAGAVAPAQVSTVSLVLAVLGALIGAVSLSGSVIAWAKLDGRLDKRYVFPGQQLFNGLVFVATVVLAGIVVHQLRVDAIVAFFVLALAVGVLMTLPIGGADMPVVISLFNAFTGLAVAFEGYVLGNEALIIAGTMVGAAGMLLTRLMAKAMNRPISGVIFSSFGASGEAQEITGSQKPIEAGDVAALMGYAERVVIVPGYGMAVAQAQHKIWELSQKLMERGVKVKFAIHPVAGRMPGHMNVLLAEAGVPYDLIADMDDINPEFKNTDVALVIGANDVVNPVATTDPASPIYGMPILDVVNSKNTIVIKRGKGTGFAGIENALFYADNTRMLYGDGAEMAAALVSELKALDGGH